MPSCQAIPQGEIPNPLTWESTLNAKNGLSVVLAINRRVFVKNSSKQEQCLPEGAIIAGWFRGKFWHHRADNGPKQKKKAKKDEEEITEVTDADVLFSLQDADSKVSMNGKVMSVGAVVAEKRQTHADAGVQYHELKDQPKAGNPAWFTLETQVDIYFRAENIPVKSPVEGETPKIPMQHLAGCLKASDWDTPSSQCVWAVKWSPTVSKGLGPVRPMIVTKVPVKIPPESAVELTAKSATEAG